MNGLTQTLPRQSFLALWHTPVLLTLTTSLCGKVARRTAARGECSEAQTTINLCEHAVITFVLDITLRFGQWRDLNNMTDMKRKDFV